MMEKISVIVPVYNAENFLQENVNCLTGQSYKEIEVVYVDDGSQDHSLAILEQAEKKDNRIHILHTKHLGVSEARNAGLKVATGDYISFVDADDLIETTMLEKLLAEMSSCDYVCCAYKCFGATRQDRSDDYRLLIKRYGRDITARCVAENISTYFAAGVVGSVCNKMFRKRIIEDSEIKFPSTLYEGEDLIFGLKYLHACDSIRILDESYYLYRTHEGQTTKKMIRPGFCRNNLTLFSEIEGWVKSYDFNQSGMALLWLRWLMLLEWASRNMDWNDQQEVSEFRSALKNEKTQKAINQVSLAKAGIRLDKKVFVTILRSGNIKSLQSYGRVMKCLHHIVDKRFTLK